MNYIRSAIDRHIGQRLREQRLSHGLSESDLADRLAITTTQLQLFEYGLKRIPPHHLIRTAEIFGVSIGTFIEDAPMQGLGTLRNAVHMPRSCASLRTRSLPFDA